MSTFQVTEAASGGKTTVNANQVVRVNVNGEGAAIDFVNGDSVNVKESYRSVRGYLVKALSPAKQEPEAE